MDFYYHRASAPCRSVLMAAKALGVELNKKPLNIMQGDHLQAEYLKINPQHTIPTLVDDGFALWESRAIIVYLVEKYGKDDSLYPKDPQKQAVINQCLHFDMGVLYNSFLAYYSPQFLLRKPADPEKFIKVETAFDFLNTFLENQEYFAGEEYTIADIVILGTVSTFDVMNFKLNSYPNVDRWYKNVQKKTPGWDENWVGLMDMKMWIDSKMKEQNTYV